MSRDNEDRPASLEHLPTISSDGSEVAPSQSRRKGASSVGSEFLAGQMIAGRFRVVSHLGSGGMGNVYRADDHVAVGVGAFEDDGVARHGDLELTREETRLCDTLEFQRLRGVKQLGTANLVYPGAARLRGAAEEFDKRHSLDSLRYEAMRDGIEDYELLRAVWLEGKTIEAACRAARRSRTEYYKLENAFLKDL